MALQGGIGEFGPGSIQWEVKKKKALMLAQTYREMNVFPSISQDVSE